MSETSDTTAIEEMFKPGSEFETDYIRRKLDSVYGDLLEFWDDVEDDVRREVAAQVERAGYDSAEHIDQIKEIASGWGEMIHDRA